MTGFRHERFPRSSQNSPPWEKRMPPPPPEYDHWSPIAGEKRVVCGDCVKDDVVRVIVCRSDDEDICDYCGRNSPPFGDVQELFEYIYRSLLLEYGDPFHHAIFWDKEDGRWIGISELDTYDVLYEVDDPLGEGTELAESFAQTIEHDWYLIGSEVGTEEERSIWSWDSFEQRLLNGPRLLFSRTETDPHEPTEMSANELFLFLSNLGEQLQTDFIKKAKTGLQLFRARVSSTKYYTSPDELGSPRAAVALPQRLSAAGVPCFYASEDCETAIAETKSEKTEYVTVGHWKTTHAIVYADFASPLELPNLFDYTVSQKRHYILFLREFADRITRPADETLGNANSYLATQVLGEFLRYYLPTKWKQGIDAVRFPSKHLR